MFNTQLNKPRVEVKIPSNEQEMMRISKNLLKKVDPNELKAKVAAKGIMPIDTKES